MLILTATNIWSTFHNAWRCGNKAMKENKAAAGSSACFVKQCQSLAPLLCKKKGTFTSRKLIQGAGFLETRGLIWPFLEEGLTNQHTRFRIHKRFKILKSNCFEPMEWLCPSMTLKLGNQKRVRRGSGFREQPPQHHSVMILTIYIRTSACVDEP